MSRSPLEFLRHIAAEAEYLLRVRAGTTLRQLQADETLQRAVTRSLEIIGEASKQVPESIRDAHPEVDWRAMAGMRDRLIHSYFSVDLEIVWDVVDNRIPDLAAHVQRIIEKQSLADEPPR